jgi:hypothetical protein
VARISKHGKRMTLPLTDTDSDIYITRQVKVKLSLYLMNEALDHEDIWGNGQLLAPATSPLEDQPPASTVYEAGWAQNSV